MRLLGFLTDSALLAPNCSCEVRGTCWELSNLVLWVGELLGWHVVLWRRKKSNLLIIHSN